MRNVLWNKISAKNNFFLSFSDFVRKHVRFLAKRILESCKNCILRVQMTFLGTFFLDKVINFYGVNTLIEKPSEFWRRFSAGFSNLQFTSHEECFVEQEFCKIQILFGHFRSLCENMSDFWQNQFWRVVEIAFFVSKWRFWGTFPEKNIKFLWCQDFDRKTFGILAKIFGRFLTPAVYVSWGKFCGMKFLGKLKFFLSFAEFLRKHIQLLEQRLLQSCQNCILPVQMNVLRNFFSGKSINFYGFDTLSKNLSDFWQKLSAGFSKL